MVELGRNNREDIELSNLHGLPPHALKEISALRQKADLLEAAGMTQSADRLRRQAVQVKYRELRIRDKNRKPGLFGG